jgi:NAD(P)-dependent dehydrogenase (short-subunit alcohol dehydrogenase family)
MLNTRKTAIVTGASRGIGAGLVEAFLKRGYSVVANSRNITKANPFAADAHVALVDGDIGHPSTAAMIVDTAVSRFGRIDVLINKIMLKGALNAVTRALAIEYAKEGIRVNTIAPGVINTPMHKPETHDFLKGLHPVGRIGEVKEVVDAALFLTDATFTSGEILHVDGGAHAGKW